LSLFTLDTYHRQDLPEPHWYLLLLAISPAHQGQGIGSSLLAPILTQADQEQISCYVEVFTEAAVNFYRKHGFEMVRTVLLSKQGPTAWSMRRKPQQQMNSDRMRL
jgi:ribosomal protein S18 acetylase RimI-like enzyme